MNKEYNRDVAIDAIKRLHKRNNISYKVPHNEVEGYHTTMNNVELFNHYSKIVGNICKIGDTGGTHHDTHYYNKQGALQDWSELEEMVKSLDERYNDDVNDICERLDKALIVAKTIDKMNKLEDILDKNIQYG